MEFLVVVTPPSIYHGCSTRKTVWKEKFTGKKQDLFESVNTRNFGQRSVRKHKEIKGSDKCVTLNMYEVLNISEKFDDLDKMKTTSSESKVKMEGSGKGLVTALAIKTKARSKKYKKARYAIGNFSTKDLSNKIKGFEKLLRYPVLKGHPNMNPLLAIFI